MTLREKKNFSFTYVNAHVALQSKKNMNLKEDLESFSALYSDGSGVFMASKFLYGKYGLPQRINGTDLYYKVLDLAEKENYKIFFFGGGKIAAEVLESRIKEKYPNLKIGGILERKINFSTSDLEKINQSNSDILFLGLGTPYQEKWIATLGKKCNIPVQISVGSGIDFLSGTYKRAPIIFRSLYLEWLFRLLIEPRRLWKRYIIGIPVFIISIFKQKLFNSFKA